MTYQTKTKHALEFHSSRTTQILHFSPRIQGQQHIRKLSIETFFFAFFFKYRTEHYPIFISHFRSNIDRLKSNISIQLGETFDNVAL